MFGMRWASARVLYIFGKHLKKIIIMEVIHKIHKIKERKKNNRNKSECKVIVIDMAGFGRIVIFHEIFYYLLHRGT